MSMAQVLKLKPVFTDAQAEALVGLFDQELATKRDTAAITAEVEKLRLEVQRDMKATEARLVTWVVGQGAATIGILFVLLHFFRK